MCLNQTIWVSIYFLFMRIISKNIKYHRNTLIFFFNSIFHELVWLYNLIEIHRLFQSYCESHVVWCNIIRQAFVEVKKMKDMIELLITNYFPCACISQISGLFLWVHSDIFLTLDFTNMITIFLVLRQKLQSFILKYVHCLMVYTPIVSMFRH